jgi:putative transcriptional regulator
VVQVLEDGSTRPLEDRTDWARVDAMTETEIEDNAISDPDNPPLTAEQLARMQQVPNPIQIRQRLRMTQQQFAARFHLRIGTVRDWEQGVKEPDNAAKTLLRVIDKNPEAVIQALENQPQENRAATHEPVSYASP